MNGRREATEEELLLRLRKDLVQTRAHSALRGRIAPAIHVRGVLQQAEHALLAQLGERVQVEGLAIRRGEVDLEVAGVHNQPDRRVDRQRHAVHQRVRHVDRQDRERPNRKAASRHNLDQVRIVKQTMLFELPFEQRERELRAINRHIQLGEYPGQSANVILVTVREHDRSDLVAVLRQVADVRNDNVDAEQLFFGKHEAGIDDNDVVLPSEGHAVHAELAQAPEGDHTKFILCHFWLDSTPLQTHDRIRVAREHVALAPSSPDIDRTQARQGTQYQRLSQTRQKMPGEPVQRSYFHFQSASIKPCKRQTVHNTVD